MQVRDPYESVTVEVRGSGMEGGGEGVFARRNLPAHTLAAVFNGYRVPLYGGTHPATGIDDEQERYERLAYNIHMPEDENFYIDFPPDQADTRKYCASLGHKVGQYMKLTEVLSACQVNHPFHPNCEFGTVQHPVWGRVRTVVTLQPVRRGEELLVDYG